MPNYLAEMTESGLKNSLPAPCFMKKSLRNDTNRLNLFHEKSLRNDTNRLNLFHEKSLRNDTNKLPLFHEKKPEKP